VHRLASRVIRDGFYFTQLFDTFLGMQIAIGVQEGVVESNYGKTLQAKMQAKEERGQIAEFLRVRKKRLGINASKPRQGTRADANPLRRQPRL
jgi:hypothetical protein